MAVDSIIARPTNRVRVIVAEASGCCASELSAVATAFPAFKGKFGKSVEGILGAGGVSRQPSTLVLPLLIRIVGGEVSADDLPGLAPVR